MPQNSPQGARVFLVDDHPAMRAGLALLLTQPGHVICGEAENRAQVRQGLTQAQARIALVDLSPGEESGLHVLDGMKALRKLGIRSQSSPTGTGPHIPES